MTTNLTASLKITAATKARLIARMRYGDNFDRAISHLLDLADSLDKPKPSTQSVVEVKTALPDTHA